MALELHLSGGQLNSSSDGSLGGIMSDTIVTTDVVENLFDNINRSESLLGRTEYRCFYIKNNGIARTANVFVTISAKAGITDISLGLDPAGKGDGSTRGVATSIVTEDTTPTGVRWFDVHKEWDTVVFPVGAIKDGEAVAVWLRRETEQGASQTVTFDLKVDWDTVGTDIVFPGDDVDDDLSLGEMYKVEILTAPFVIGTAKIGQSEIG